MGRIVELIMSSDGRVRSVTVLKDDRTCMTTSVSNLYPLEMHVGNEPISPDKRLTYTDPSDCVLAESERPITWKNEIESPSCDTFSEEQTISAAGRPFRKTVVHFQRNLGLMINEGAL